MIYKYNYFNIKPIVKKWWPGSYGISYTHAPQQITANVKVVLKRRIYLHPSCRWRRRSINHERTGRESRKIHQLAGKRYEVDVLRVMCYFFAAWTPGTDWDLDLKKLYEAYLALEDFSTENFRPYVAQRHSPGRGLLLHLGLIA